MPIVGLRVSVAATATPIVAGAGSANNPVPAVVINQDATVSVFLGGFGVTASSGVELKAGTALPVTLMQGDALYGVTASGTVRVDVLAGQQ